MDGFAQRLKKLINENNITQSYLAKMLNQADSTISQWINGKRNPDSETLQRIADFFNVSIDYLLGRTDIRTPPTDPDKPDPREGLDPRLLQQIGRLTPEGQKKVFDYIEMVDAFEKKEREKLKNKKKH